MGFVDEAGFTMAYRGYDYCVKSRVLSCKKTADGVYKGKVQGNGAVYDVEIITFDPHASKCTCPFAKKTENIICKHMTAIYFTAFPDEAIRFHSEYERIRKEAEDRQANIQNALVKRIREMERSELENALIAVLQNGPHEQYEQFLRDYVQNYF